LLQVQALTDLGRLPEAGAALADADALFAPLRADKRYAAHRPLLARARWAMAAGDPVRAQGAIDEASSVLAATAQGDDPAWHKICQLQADDRLLRARAERMLGHTEAARADAALAERHARAAGGDDHPLVRLARAESLR
jgi:hypothetical protein